MRRLLSCLVVGAVAGCDASVADAPANPELDPLRVLACGGELPVYQVAARTPVSLDWSGVTLDTVGDPVDPTALDDVQMFEYDMSPADVISNFCAGSFVAGEMSGFLERNEVTSGVLEYPKPAMAVGHLVNPEPGRTGWLILAGASTSEDAGTRGGQFNALIESVEGSETTAINFGLDE